MIQKNVFVILDFCLIWKKNYEIKVFPYSLKKKQLKIPMFVFLVTQN